MAARAQQALDRVGSAFTGQLAALVDAAHGSADSYARMLSLTNDTLVALQSPTQAAPTSLGDHLRQREVLSRFISERIEELDHETDDSLRRQLAVQLGELETSFQMSLPNTIDSNFGPVRLLDYLRANTIVAARLAYDLTGTPTREALGESVRALGSVISERFPGQSIEIRVPPLMAIQVGAFGDAPTHTRGTPPNVVEMNPRVFMDVSTGRRSWADCAADGLLTYSGAHAGDAARMMPVIRL